ncbi:hypothetical protein P8C59_008017 [Phyllachora maydis]|uniref:HMG box domain-containing protein n=1 Tax=Phyllachora maydis TaxID=1825666 RepID=A0AAD9IBD9_9PEZI|nr:hypothetical protein P8C59_008017 [Phyllachora maydis]
MARPKKEVQAQAQPGLAPPVTIAAHAAAAAAAAQAQAQAAAAAASASAPPQAASAAAAASQTVVIDRANFTKVRDSVYARLSTIQDLIKSFSIDYLRQTNLLLGEGTNLDLGGELDQIQNAFGSLLPMLGPPPAFPAMEEKKERKKRVHDPNAPKRPLTPYFLYMQTARPIIAGDLGADAPKGAVQEEGQRRWGVMTPSEKHGWNNAYQYNLRLYNARVHAYKSGNADAKNFTDEEALTYADQHGIPQPTEAVVVDDVTGNEPDAIAEQLLLPPPEPSPPPPQEEETPAKTPRKSKESRKKKTATPVAAEPEPESDPVEEPVATPASPEPKKRKRTSKAVEATAAAAAAAAAAAEEPKKSSRKKARSG